jgi:hypothetical protein
MNDNLRKRESPVQPPLTQTSYGGGPDPNANLPAATTPRAQPAAVQTVRAVGEAIGECFSRMFSEARAFASLKIALGAVYLVFLGAGFTAKAIATGPWKVLATFVLASPTTTQAILGLGALAFLLGGNIYISRQRANDQRKLWEIVGKPDFAEDARVALLKKLQR